MTYRIWLRQQNSRRCFEIQSKSPYRGSPVGEVDVPVFPRKFFVCSTCSTCSPQIHHVPLFHQVTCDPYTIFLALFPCVPIASNMLCSPAPYIWLWFFGLVPLFESSLQNRPCSQGDPRPKFSVVSKESLSIVSATHILSFIQDVILRSMFISNL
jgi:hypothetical protein